MEINYKRKTKCPVCLRFKFWDIESKKNRHKYIQCKNCLSIINYDKLYQRLNKKLNKQKDEMIPIEQQNKNLLERPKEI